MITSINKALEYLVYHQKGSVKKLMKKIDIEAIDELSIDRLLKLEEDNYELTQKGADYYSKNVYVQKERSRGLFGFLGLVFD